jgi:hypothetical protein
MLVSFKGIREPFGVVVYHPDSYRDGKNHQLLVATKRYSQYKQKSR